MRKVALRGLFAHKARMIMTVAAVTLGVAFISGVLTFSDTMQRSFDDLFATVYEGTDAVVRSDETVDGDFGAGDERGTIDESVLETVRAVPTVQFAAGEVEGFAQVIDPEGEIVSGGTFGGPSFATSVDPDEPGIEDELAFGLREGDWPREDTEMVLDAATVRSTGYELGDSVPVQTNAGRHEYTLVGSVGFGSSDSAAGNSVVLLTTAAAQQTFGEPGRLSSISVVATDGTSQEKVVEDLVEVLPAGVEAISGKEITEETQSTIREGLSFFTVILMAFAVVALVVGAFVIYNSFSIIVAQRTREMALLRAIGASRRQVRRSVFIEALFLGLVGSLLGVGLGVGLAAVFSGFLDTDGDLVVAPGSVILAVVVGLVITVVSALWPAWRASRVPPVAAMRDTAFDHAGQSRLRLISGAVLLAIGVILSVSGAQGNAVSSVGLGVASAFVGVLLAAPALARPIGSLLGWPLARFRGITGGMARQNAVRNPRRTAATALALTIGVGIVAFILVFNASIRASIDGVLDDEFAGDFVVDTGSWGLIGLPDEVGEGLAALPEVDLVAPERWVSAEVDGRTTSVTGTSSDLFELYGAEVSGSTDLGPGEVVVLDGTRIGGRKVGVGDEVTVRFLDAGEVTWTIAGLYEPAPIMELGRYIVGLGETPASATDASVTVTLAANVTHDEGRAAIDAVVEQIYPTAEVQDVEDLKEMIGSELDGLLLFVLGLLLLTIVIAFFGIMNTVGLSVLERTRELGLLRAVGATRRQVRSAIRWESVIIALFGAVLGLAVGVLGGWGLVTSLADEGFTAFSLPVANLVVLAIVAGVLGVVAALWPAIRAARLNILAAIRTE